MAMVYLRWLLGVQEAMFRDPDTHHIMNAFEHIKSPAYTFKSSSGSGTGDGTLENRRQLVVECIATNYRIFSRSTYCNPAGSGMVADLGS